MWIPVSDNVRLSTRLWLPESLPAPVVLEYIPYRTRDLYRAADNFWGAQLAANGIAYARVDVRGTGDSDGVITDEYTDIEIDDGIKVIDWLAGQPWSNGRVGMRGISWGAINALYVAARQPAHLQAIMAIAGTDNRYTDDAHFIGDCVAHTGFQWGTLFKTVMAAPPDPEISGERWSETWQDRLDATPEILGNWLQRYRDPAAWDPLETSNIRTPTYLVAGWQDTYSNPTWRLFHTLDVPRKCIIGAWGHTYPYFAPQGLSWIEEEAAWWKHWLTDEQTGVMSAPFLNVFIPDVTASEAKSKPQHGRWVALPQRTPSAFSTWHFSDAALTTKRGSAPDSVISGEHIVGQTKPEWLDRPPLEQSYDDGLSLTFDSEPLQEPFELLGNPQVHLRLKADRPDATIAVRLTELTPEGHSWLISYGVQRLEDDTGDFIRVTIDLAATAHRFSPGNSLRIAVSQSLWPLIWPAPERFTLTLDTDECRLDLPPLPSGAYDYPPPSTVHSRNAQSFDAYTIVPADASGQLTLEHHEPESPLTTDTGITVTRSSEQSSSIIQTHPNSGHWSQTTSVSWQRADWHVEVSAGYDLTSEAHHFKIREWLRAKNSDAVVYEQDITNIVSR